MINGLYEFVKEAPDLYVILMYLQVDEKYFILDEIPKNLLYYSSRKRFSKKIIKRILVFII